jgi:GNAT superfamily N-acetyltransferase
MITGKRSAVASAGGKFMRIRKLTEENDRQQGLALALRVFFEFVAPEFAPEGVAHFQKFVADRKETEQLELYGAYVKGTIAGVIATGCRGKHISLFFVDKSFQRQGIGKRLFETVLKHAKGEEITVHSSPCAVEIYRRLGFAATDGEQLVNGIRYTPMRRQKESS